MCKLLSTGILRFVLCVINVVFFIAGGSALAVGTWFAVDKVFISDIIGTDLFSAASYLMIVCGVFFILISILGCAGSLIQNRKFLFVYVIAVLLILVVYVSTAIIAAVFQGEAAGSLSQNMQTTLLKSYGYNTATNAENKRITDSWDFTQKTLKCCAVDETGFALYRQTHFYKDQIHVPEDQKKFVPESCCKFLEHKQRYLDLNTCQSRPYGPPRSTQKDGAVNDALYYTGCLNKAQEFAVEYSGILLALGFGFIIVLVGAIIFAICLYQRLQKSFQPVATEETYHI